MLRKEPAAGVDEVGLRGLKASDIVGFVLVNVTFSVTWRTGALTFKEEDRGVILKKSLCRDHTYWLL